MTAFPWLNDVATSLLVAPSPSPFTAGKSQKTSPVRDLCHKSHNIQNGNKALGFEDLLTRETLASLREQPRGFIKKNSLNGKRAQGSQS